MVSRCLLRVVILDTCGVFVISNIGMVDITVVRYNRRLIGLVMLVEQKDQSVSQDPEEG